MANNNTYLVNGSDLEDIAAEICEKQGGGRSLLTFPNEFILGIRNISDPTIFLTGTKTYSSSSNTFSISGLPWYPAGFLVISTSSLDGRYQQSYFHDDNLSYTTGRTATSTSGTYCNYGTYNIDSVTNSSGTTYGFTLTKLTTSNYSYPFRYNYKWIAWSDSIWGS